LGKNIKKDYKKNFSKGFVSNKKFQKQESRKEQFSGEIVEKKIEDIVGVKETVSLMGCVNKVVQTGGPTIFVLSDGTGNLSLKGFVKPGIRAYPEIVEGLIVKAVVEIGEFKGDIEGEIKSIHLLDEFNKKRFLDSMGEIERSRAKVTPPAFLVESEILSKLKESFILGATQIRLAIIQDRPIIVRHHNDTDGYSAGFALERAILPLIEKQHSSEKAMWEFFTRAPCSAPLYEIDDSIRDTANSLRNVAKHSTKMPLVLIADNGSSPEDLMGIRQGKVHGADFIVIDHHYFETDVISKEVLVHINPFLVGDDGARFSAGMLCAEFCRFINPDVKNIEQIPALAGFADRIEIANPEIMEKYLKLIEPLGYTRELLSDISLLIEYVSSKVKFMEAREYIEVLFGEPRAKQERLVELMVPYIKKLDEKGLKIGKANAKLDNIGKVNVQILYFEEFFPGFGFFPKPGRIVGMLHDSLQKEKNISNLITVGIMATAMTIRATNESNFSVHDFISYLNEKIPEAFVEGGGHKNAGSITFLPNKQKDVFNLFKEFVRFR
jgi:RecJ-like exonuclease